MEDKGQNSLQPNFEKKFRSALNEAIRTRNEKLQSPATDIAIKAQEEEFVKSTLNELRGRLSEAERKTEQAIKLSMTDTLTGLPNLRWLERETEKKIKLAEETGQPLWFLELDFDNFKKINTVYGQEGGDEALKAITSLTTRGKDNEDIARIGGDEFGQLIVGNLGQEEMKQLVQRYVSTMREASSQILSQTTPINPSSSPLTEFTLCIGIAPYQKGDNLTSLKARADLALKQAKTDPDKGTGYLVEMDNGIPNPIPLR